MIQNNKSQNVSYKAFTLIEMVIVLIIMGIMLMFAVSLSGDQIQKVKDKAVKESILAEMQTRYSKNLGSSSFAGKMYNTMEVILTNGENKIDFKYDTKDGNTENTFINRFELKHLGVDYKPNEKSLSQNMINLEYSPYKISCKIGEDENNKNLVIIANVNGNRNYCFEIDQKNCRLTEISKDSCKTLHDDAGLDYIY